MSLYAEASPIRLPNREMWFVTPHNRFPLLQSPVAACFTPLHLTPGIALGDVRFECSCWAMENYSTKLYPHSFCADIKMPVEVWTLQLWNQQKGGDSYVPSTHSVTERSHSVTSHGLSLHGWVAAVPKFFHFPIISLTVDRGISRRDDISQTDSLQRWHPVSVPHLWMLTAWLGALFLYTLGLIETPESCK